MYKINAGIFAAGKGKRFKKDFPNTPKPLIKLGKKALIDYAIDNISSINPDKMAILLNLYEGEIVYKYLKENNYKGISIMIDSKSSFESFFTLANFLKEKNHAVILSTVDTILKKDEIKNLIQQHINKNSYITVGITDFINDEKPLLVDIDKTQEKITSIGIKGNYVTNGIYLLSYDAITDIEPKFYKALRKFLSSIDFNKKTVSYYIIKDSLDIDDISDLSAFKNKLDF